MRVRPAPELLAQMPEYLDTGQVSQVLGLSPSRVRHYIAQGMLVAEREGPSWRVKRQDLARFMTSWQPGIGAGSRRADEGPEAIWATLQALVEAGEATAAQLGVAVGRHEGNVRKYLGFLRCRGFVTTRSGAYAATAAGRAHVAESKELAQAS